MAAKPIEKIVLFTVSTCGLNSDDLGADEKEICLLAWQVIDTAKIQPATLVEYCYIRPSDPIREERTPVGIEAKCLVKAPLLSEGLKKLQSILSPYPDHTYCIATNGPHALRQCLFPEMSRKVLSVPQFAFSFFDLRKELSKRTNYEFHPESLSDMCEYLGVDCPLGEVYGEEEIKVLARVVQKMLSQGHAFESPEMIQESYQHTTSDAVDAGDVADGCVIRLRGLPFQADHKGVAKFLYGLNILPGGVVFSINAVGRRTGEAVVALETEEQAALGLKRNRHYIGKRYIEVYEGSADEFMELAGGGVGVGDGDAFVARLQGLPYKASEQDICDFFGRDATVKNGSDGVFIVRYPNGRASGDAFVLFNSDQNLKQAMSMNKEDMMGRYVELFCSSLKEFLTVLNKSGSPEQLEQFSFLNPQPSSGGDSVTAVKRGSERNCVKLRGLPWEATAEDVIEFFGDMSKNIQQHGVHMVLNSQNRPTGDCYVQMATVDSASKAADRLHKRNIGRRYIEVFQCSGTEVTFALMDSAGVRPSGQSFQGGNKRRKSNGARVKARGLPYNTNEYDLVNFFMDFNIEENDVEILYNQSGKSTGVAFVEFPSPTDARKAVKDLNNKYIGSRYVELTLA